MEFKAVFSKPAYSTYEKGLEKEVLDGKMPKHVALIMDGNRRYASEVLNDDVNKGHKMGEEKIEEMLDWCFRLKIPYITVYAFSTENFNRDEDEVEYVMDLAEAALYRMADNPKVQENRVRIKVLGDHNALPAKVREAMEYADEKTRGFDDFIFSVALAYGGRQEIVSAVKEISKKVKDNEMDIKDITEEIIGKHLYTSDMPDPDLVLRTSGEIRISNFLIWQLAYSELYFADVYWPRFRYIDFLRAIRTYQQRVRRYGE